MNTTRTTLNNLVEKVKTLLPLPQDFATQDPLFASEILNDMRNNNISFFELPMSQFQLAYQLSALCSEEEFAKLSDAFEHRVNLALFKTGWIYCQYHPDEERAVSLFSISCKWMKSNHEKEYSKTLIGRADFPWEQIYHNSVNVMRTKKLFITPFCEKFDIIIGTLFHERLVLAWLSHCEKNDLLENEALLSDLILRSEYKYLRPAVVNYLNHISFDDISPVLYNAFVQRVEQKEDGEQIGLSPMILQKIRRQRFNVLIEEWIQSKEKRNIYTSVSERIRRMKKLETGFVFIDFGSYIVVEHEKWEAYSYAFVPKLYQSLYKMWESKDYSIDFWPGIDLNEIANAHNVILGIKKSGAVILNFVGFDALYSRDLLNSAN